MNKTGHAINFNSTTISFHAIPIHAYFTDVSQTMCAVFHLNSDGLDKHEHIFHCHITFCIYQFVLFNKLHYLIKSLHPKRFTMTFNQIYVLSSFAQAKNSSVHYHSCHFLKKTSPLQHVMNISWCETEKMEKQKNFSIFWLWRNLKLFKSRKMMMQIRMEGENKKLFN